MQLPYHVFTTQEIRYIEQEHAKQNGGHCYDLMEKAGRAVFDEILKEEPNPKMVYVMVGKGNNGGDGYIVATYLLKHNIPFRLFAFGKPHFASEAYMAAAYFTKAGGMVEYDLPDLDEESSKDKEPDVIVDALLGTGLAGNPGEKFDEWVDFINYASAYTISVDIPSGIFADTGHIILDAVMADKTVCMLGLKPGLLTGAAVDYVGEIVVCDLGFDMASYHGSLNLSEIDDDRPSLPIYVASYEKIIYDLPSRIPSGHKGTSGKVLIIGGSKGMGGAVSICGQGALRSGAGLVKIATDDRNIPAINASCPELMTLDLYGDLSAAMEWADTIAIGPGLGTDKRASDIVDLVLSCDKPRVIDADALNIIAQDGLKFSLRSILTPHPGEAARLLNTTVENIESDRYYWVYKLQQLCGGVVLLKGAGTLICDGNIIVVVREGSAAMAVGGMGDLLTGIIASFRAQGLTQMQATVSAATVHGRAGYMAGEADGMLGTLPLDLLKYVRGLVNKRTFH